MLDFAPLFSDYPEDIKMGFFKIMDVLIPFNKEMIKNFLA